VLLSRWFKQLDRVAVRVFNLNLTSAGTGFHLVAKAQAGALECGDTGREIRDFQDDTVPATGLLTLTSRQRPRSGGSGATEQDVRIAQRDIREGRELLMLQLETEMLRVKTPLSEQRLSLGSGCHESL
jgi:hypothetical protein